ncbi:MAG: hypothetical protein IPM64_05055 [Phycisphaerales bacterium]|nr:hypothetical protein [Phycisphaerales bacterium]
MLLIGGTWRLALAAAMPIPSRDGVTFLRHAEAIALDAGAALRDRELVQHPLFPLLIAGLGVSLPAVPPAPDNPEHLLRTGQVVSLLSGAAVIMLCAGLSRRVAALLMPEASAAAHRLAGLWGGLIAVLLPLNTWLSADVMSDQLHAAFYLACLSVALHGPCPRAGLASGLFGGLAFLTRPEGAVAGAAAGLGMATDPRPRSMRGRAAALVAVLIGFLCCAIPYWQMSGRWSSKEDKQPLSEFVSTARGPGSVGVLAALERRDLSPVLAVPAAAWEVFRAGRVVVTLAGAIALVSWWRAILRSPLRMLLFAGLTHFALTAWLLYRHGYLSPRHELIVVLLLIPLAAAGLVQLAIRSWERRGGWLIVAAAAAVVVFPLAVYSLRVPNREAALLRPVALSLRADPELHGALLLGGSNHNRVAYFASMRFQPWPENLPDADARFAALRDHILHHRPRLVAIDVGRSDETGANSALLERLQTDLELSRHLHPREQNPAERAARDGIGLMLLDGLWTKPASQPGDAGVP